MDDILSYKPKENWGVEEAIQIEKWLVKDKENKVSTYDAVIEDDNLPDVQTIQEKEKQVREKSLEVQGTQVEASTATAFNLGRVMECLSYQILSSDINVLNHAELHHGSTDEGIEIISK